MKYKKYNIFIYLLIISFLTINLQAQPRLMENLGRGLIAIPSGQNEVYIGWRYLGTDSSDVAFNLYRMTAGIALKLNNAPLTGSTNFIDPSADLEAENTYYLCPVHKGVEEQPAASVTLPVRAPLQSYFAIPLRIPNGGTTPDNQPFTYNASDGSVGDLDGDGEYEIVLKWDPTNAQDNANSGYTGNVYLDAYKLNGTLLWRIDLGKNIRAGAHYTQFMVYDLDGDGKAEVACKTADGTVDGTGHAIGDVSADHRNSSGFILSGPEYLTIFNGLTGAELATTNYDPPRGTVSDWGDAYGNRVDRFLACIAYLDGARPSLVMCRGYYTRTVLVAWNFRDGQLTKMWTFDSNNGYPGYAGQGNHNLSVADIDDDGKDEIVFGACAIDHDGKGLYSTGLGHGDAMHLSDLDPDRPGLEVWQAHETASQAGGEFRDARTGDLIWGNPTSDDNKRALAADIDPTRRGYEVWSQNVSGVRDCKGNLINTERPGMNFAVWWDGDLLRELLDDTTISKWDWINHTANVLLHDPACSSNNGTKATPVLSADLFGDWREEVIWRKSDNTELRIYTTTIPTGVRVTTLMHDPEYRLSIAWQNAGYNQPPHPAYFLGDGMLMPPQPDIITKAGEIKSPRVPLIKNITADNGPSASDRITNRGTFILNGISDAGNNITISRVDSGIHGTTYADGIGNWSFDYTAAPLADGSYLFAATARDDAGNESGSSPYFQVMIDTQAPQVVSCNRQDPPGEATAYSSVTFRIVCSEKVYGVDPGDFSLSCTESATGVIASVSANSGTAFIVTVNAITGFGSLRLEVKNNNTITDIAGNALPGFTTGQSYRIIRPYTWIQPAGGLWSDTSNWLDGNIGDGASSNLFFNSLDLAADSLVLLDSPRVAGNLTFGDTLPATPGNWLIGNDGEIDNTLTLSLTTGAPSITVNMPGSGANTTISAILAGTSGFNKAGSGLLAIAGNNTLSGPVNVNAGSLRIDAGGYLTTTSVNIANNGAQLNIDGGVFSASGTTTLNAGSGSSVVVNSGNADFNVLATNNTSGGIIRINGGIVKIGSLTLPRSSDGTINYSTGFIIKGGKTTVGTISLGTNNSNGVMSVENGETLVTGAVIIGNQATSGRGGALRVTGGLFYVTDRSNGIIITRRASNTASAHFLGGTSMIEKVTLGYDNSVNAGSATLNIDGGTVYMGNGGIVKNGSAAFGSVINLTSGVLGAAANWSSACDMVLPAGNRIIVKTADHNNENHTIALAGALTGAGGFTKTGNGTLILSGTSTYAGTTVINEGTLRVDGSLSGETCQVILNSTGTLSGSGTLRGSVILNADGAIAPGNASDNATLECGSLTWNGGGKLSLDIGTPSDALRVNGPFTKGDAGTYYLAIGTSGLLPVDAVYTLITFGEIGFTASDFALSLPDGLAGTLSVNSNSLQFTVTKNHNEPPVLTLPQNIVSEATSPAGAVVVFSASAFDAVDGERQVGYSHEPGTVFPLGATTVTVTASDLSHNVATGSFTVIVRDTTAPVIEQLSATPNVLWPPNHMLVAVTLQACVSDVFDPDPVTHIVSVSSNEELNRLPLYEKIYSWLEQHFGFHPQTDWEITGDLSLKLRAERFGNCTGRIYSIRVESRDNSGNVSYRDVTVTVPKHFNVVQEDEGMDGKWQ